MLKIFPKCISCYSSYRENDPNHSINPDWELGKEPYDNEPTYTTFCNWKGTLDYIFLLNDNNFNYPTKNENNESHSNQDNFLATYMLVNKILKIPNVEYLEPGLPNMEFPSDHIPIMSEIDLFNDK